jgi:hypothetical protein
VNFHRVALELGKARLLKGNGEPKLIAVERILFSAMSWIARSEN